MTEKELIDSLTRMGPSDAQIERMLERISNPESRKAKLGMRRFYRIALPAVCMLLFLLIAMPGLNRGEERQITQLRPVAVPFSAGIPRPGEGRSLGVGAVAKYLNYEGSRYSFVADGRAFELGDLGLEKSHALGLLQYDILEDLQGGGASGYASRDFGTTYLAGGTIYRLPGYDPAFRLAVKHEERYYIAQLSGRTDDSAIPAKDYVSLAGLEKLTDQVELMDSSGAKRLYEWTSREDVLRITKEVAGSAPAVLSGEDYEKLASAQAGGQTCLMRWNLKDGTAIDMPIVPGMSLITIGDGKYELTRPFLNNYLTIPNSKG